MTRTRSLASLARSSDPAVRQLAVAAVADPGALAEIAARSEHKDAAVAAVDRIDDLESLRTVAARARNKAAGRRARERMASLAPAGAATPCPETAGAEGADVARERWVIRA